MQAFEYQVVPAPRKGKTGKGVRGAPEKFAHALASLMNEMGADGWEYLRADTLPCEERQGLTGKAVKYHSMLVFRRELAEEVVEEDVSETLALPGPEPETVEEQAAPVEDSVEPEDDTIELVEEPTTPETSSEVANDTAQKRETVAAE